MKIKILVMFFLFTIIGLSQVRDSIIYMPGEVVYKDTTINIPGEIIYQDTIVNVIVDSTLNICKNDTIRLVYIQLPPTIEYNYIYNQLPSTIEYNYIYNYIPSDTVCNPVIIDSNYIPPTLNYSVVLQSVINGNINPSAGTYTYNEGTSITLTAIPNTGYEFNYWVINGQIITINPLTKIIDSDLNISANFKLKPIVTGNSFYVWKNAPGNNSGTSWDNAWKSFSAINWNLIQPGDALYISGGTDSIIYSETLEPNLKGTANKWCLITNGSYSPNPTGHTGKVIIDGKNQTQTGILLRNGGNKKPSYVRIKDLTIKNVYRGVDANFDEAHDCIALDGLTILNNAERGIIFETLLSFNVDSIFIENCIILTDDMSNGESDGIFLKGTHHNFIDNNWIRVKNQDPVQHVDALQSYLCNGFVITNNILINDSVYSQEGGGIPIILGSQGSNPVIIYNNFVYMGGVWMPGANWGGTLMTRWYDESTKPPTWILNNTVISNGPRVRGVWLEYSNATNTVVINNIIAQYSTNTNGVLDNLDNSTGATLRVDSIRNNLYYQSWRNDVGFAGNFTGKGKTGTPSSWADFINNYGGTGINSDPKFVNKIGYISNQSLLNGQLQNNSPAINQAENIKWLLNKLDIIYKLNGRLKWENINGISRDIINNIGAY